jgi:hypothetical protein
MIIPGFILGKIHRQWKFKYFWLSLQKKDEKRNHHQHSK